VFKSSFWRRSQDIDLTQVRDWLRLARESGYSAVQMAHLCDLSVRHLNRCCHDRFGRSTQQWLDEQRIIAARRLLRERACVKAVALALGFKQSSHFCRQFKFYHGITPTQFVVLGTRKGLS